MSHNIFKNGLGYEGKVTLTLKSNNRVLKSRTYKNNGTENLFRFLGYCLIGHYADVEHLLPNKIALLYNQSSSLADADPYDVVARSGFKGIAHTPSVISTGTGAGAEVKVTYSFEISKNEIFKKETTDVFNQVALYGEGNIDINTDIKNFSAYYFLVDDITNDFAALDPMKWSETTVLLIDWELSLSNKNIATTNN